MFRTTEIDLMQTLQCCETSVWDALVDGNADADNAALHSDFLGVYSDGFASKADHVGQLANGPSVARYSLADFQLKALGGEHAILSYRADFLRTGTDDPETMYVSSIWQRDPAGWINIFSQDTPASS